MGYCPRCGEHSPYREYEQELSAELRPIRIARDSRIVPLPPDLPDGATLSYAGCFFQVRRLEDRYELRLLRVGYA